MANTWKVVFCVFPRRLADGTYSLWASRLVRKDTAAGRTFDYAAIDENNVPRRHSAANIYQAPRLGQQSAF